jgi:hypothetical protein
MLVEEESESKLAPLLQVLNAKLAGCDAQERILFQALLGAALLEKEPNDEEPVDVDAWYVCYAC